MLKRHAWLFGQALSLFDMALIVGAHLLAFYLRYGAAGYDHPHAPLQYRVFIVVYLLAWLYLSRRLHLYGSKRLLGFRSEAFAILKVIAGAMIAGTFSAFFFREDPLSRLYVVNFFVFQAAAFSGFRFVLRWTLKQLRRRGYNYRFVLVVGSNERSAKFLRRIHHEPDLGLKLLGVIDSGIPGGERASPATTPVLGTLDNLEWILRTNVVDEVFIFLPIKSCYAQIQSILEICESVGVEVKIPTDIFSHKLAKATISMYGDSPMIDLSTGPKSGKLLVKRLMDVSLSSVALLLLAPLMGVVAILVKATSKGPVLFRQKRMGYNGRTFDCLKFRTMVQGAEEMREGLLALNEMDGPVFKIRDDPRVTRVGRFLRKTSIDELPQLINILMGHMSLVGPRPPLPSEVDKYNLESLRRLSVKPGITCLWQVNGRNSVPFDKWMELDRQYIDQWSLFLDVKILLKTIPAIIRGTGA